MGHRVLALGLVWLLWFTPLSAQGRKSAPAPGPVELAQLAPGDAAFFLETQNLAALLEGIKSTAVGQLLAGPAGGNQVSGSGALPALLASGMADQAALSGIRLAITGTLSPGGTTPSQVMLLGAAPTAQTATAVLQQFSQLWDKQFEKLGPATNGRLTSYLNGKVAGGQSGHAVVFGHAPLVTAALKRGAQPATKTLAVNAEFTAAWRQLPASPVRGFVSGATIKSLLTRLAKQAPTEWGALPEAIMELSGTQAIKGLALASSFERRGVVDRVLLLVDRQTPTILSMILEPPSYQPKAAQYTPATAQSVISFGLEPQRIYESLMANLGPLLALYKGTESAEAALVELERPLGFKIKVELIGSLGNELVIISLPQAQTTGSRVSEQVLLIEQRNPAGMSRVIERLAAAFSAEKSPAETHYEVTLTTIRGTTLALVADFVVLGRKENVKLVLDAQRSNSTLSATEYFKQIAASQPAQVALQAYFDQSYGVAALTALAARGQITLPAQTFPPGAASLSGYAVKDEQGIRGEFFSPLGLVPLLLNLLPQTK